MVTPVPANRSSRQLRCLDNALCCRSSRLSALALGRGAFPHRTGLRSAAMAVTDAPAEKPKRERWTAQWAELYDEVVTTGLCTGCAGCVVVCPHEVLGYDHQSGGYRPFHLEDELGPSDCVPRQKGGTSCTRACPRFRAWEIEADTLLFGRQRVPEEVSGVAKDIVLARATDPKVHELGQDGGLVSALLLWALEHGVIDAALVSYLEGDGSSWKAKPGVARTREEVLASAGSRYTYSATTPPNATSLA